MVGKNTLRDWFSNGKKPTQEQFWEWIDSYCHVSDEIAQDKITGLKNTLYSKTDHNIFTTHLSDPDAHGIDAKLKKKVNTDLFTTHLSDPDAHGIDGKLKDKANLSFLTSEIERLEQTFNNATLESPNGSIYKLGVDDNGTLITTLIEKL